MPPALEDVTVHPAVVQRPPPVRTAVDQRESPVTETEQQQFLYFGSVPLHPGHGPVAGAEDLSQRARARDRPARLENERVRSPGLFFMHAGTHIPRVMLPCNFSQGPW